MPINRRDIPELHYITPIGNVASILEHGILSHNRIRELGIAADSVAMDEIQARRAEVEVPGGRRLHDYANVYFDARNAMMYHIRRKQRRADVCVLRIYPEILDLQQTIVTDRNASAHLCRFEPPAIGLELLDPDLVYAHYWNHPDEFERARRRAIRCAEVLVPESIAPEYIRGAWVPTVQQEGQLRTNCPDLDIQLNNDLFF